MKKVRSAIITSIFSAMCILAFAFAAQGGDAAKEGIKAGKSADSMTSMQAQAKDMENTGENVREKALDKAERKRNEKMGAAEKRREEAKEAVSEGAEEKKRIEEQQ